MCPSLASSAWAICFFDKLKLSKLIWKEQGSLIQSTVTDSTNNDESEFVTGFIQ